MQIQPRETPKHQRESFGRTVAQAVLKQFEDPKTAEDFKQWLEQRAKKGAQTHA